MSKTMVRSGSNQDYFNYCTGLTMTNERFADFRRTGASPEGATDAVSHGCGRVDSAGHRRYRAADGAIAGVRVRLSESVPGRRRGAELRGEWQSGGGGRFQDIWVQPAAAMPAVHSALHLTAYHHHLGQATVPPAQTRCRPLSRPGVFTGADRAALNAAGARFS